MKCVVKDRLLACKSLPFSDQKLTFGKAKGKLLQSALKQEPMPAVACEVKSHFRAFYVCLPSILLPLRKN